MKIPNASNAVISPQKVRDYLLNPAHRRGGPKARLLISLGYRTADWQRLEADLRQYHLTADISATTATIYGVQYEIIAPLSTPSGKPYTFRTVWQIDRGTDQPRLITMIPE